MVNRLGNRMEPEIREVVWTNTQGHTERERERVRDKNRLFVGGCGV